MRGLKVASFAPWERAVIRRQEERATDIEDQQQTEAKQPTEGPQPIRGWGVRFLRSRWFPWTSWGLSAVALGYVVSRLRLSELRTDLSGVIWWLVIVAVLQIMPRLLESLRWQYLLRPLRLRLRHLFQAVYVGTLFSGILPLSGGDVVRGVMIAGRAQVPAVRVLSTELVERVSDAVALILVVWFTLRGLMLTLALRLALGVLEVGVGLAVLLGILLMAQNVNIRQRFDLWKPTSRAWRRVRSAAVEVIESAARLTTRTLVVSLSAAAGAMVVNIGSLWCLLRAYHLPLTLLDAAAVFAIIMIGTFLPNTPSNLGPWQFFCVVGVQLFGVSAARAAGFSLVAFVLWTLPPILMGFGALLTSPFSWSELRQGQKNPEGPVPG